MNTTSARTHSPLTYWWWTLSLLTVVAAAARLININRPGWEIDEPVYASIAEHYANGDGIVGTPLYGNTTPQPYLYQPPFWSVILGTWFKVVGSGVIEARVLSVLCSLVVVVLAAVYMRRRVAPLAGLMSAGLLAVDPWIGFINRIGWLENPLMIIVLLGLLAWDRAEKRNRTADWALVGATFGAAFVFKQVAGLTLIAFIAACVVAYRAYADTWTGRARRLGAIIGSAAAITAAYFISMTLIYPGVFYDQTLNQFIRATGGRESNGSLNFSAHAIYTALTSNYWVFFGTAMCMVLAWSLIVRRAYLVVRKRSQWEGLRHLAWISVGVLAIIPFAGLLLPHYMLIVFLPSSMYLAGEAYLWLRTPQRLAVFILAGVFAITSVVGAVARYSWPNDTALSDAITYLNENTDSSDVVIADETVGVSLDGAQYCQTRKAGRCHGKATVLQTYTSATQSVAPDPYVLQAMKNWDKCAEWKGFRETIKIYMPECPK